MSVQKQGPTKTAEKNDGKITTFMIKPLKLDFKDKKDTPKTEEIDMNRGSETELLDKVHGHSGQESRHKRKL